MKNYVTVTLGWHDSSMCVCKSAKDNMVFLLLNYKVSL